MNEPYFLIAKYFDYNLLKKIMVIERLYLIPLYYLRKLFKTSGFKIREIKNYR